MNGWHLSRLTEGTEEGVFHAHSYYDIPVFDGQSRYVASHRMRFEKRQPTPADRIDVGVVDTEAPLEWRPLGHSHAWSWQQGPMAQFVPGGSATLIWNDREGERFVARRRRIDVPPAGAAEATPAATLPRPVYALSPGGDFALSLNMARLEGLRPGYGYAGGADARLDERHPEDDGVWNMTLANARSALVLSLDEACRFLLSQLRWRERQRHRLNRYVYWFNHVKIAPDSRRFTVKLRWRVPGKGWNETQGVSLTADCRGGDLRLLASATSHVIWESADTLYLWRDGHLGRYADLAPRGQLQHPIAPRLIDENVHIRRLPNGGSRFVFDTPYRRAIDLKIYDETLGKAWTIAHFTGHEPVRGAFRCDLHPCPSPDGRKIVVTSLMDGGRQLYLLRCPDDRCG